ncbi:hypothetical protein CEXT_387831, partial [Caerostris extrusa]
CRIAYGGAKKRCINPTQRDDKPSSALCLQTFIYGQRFPCTNSQHVYHPGFH